MTVHAESSAVLAWLFGEARGPMALDVLMNSHSVFASELTLVEGHRTIHAAIATGRLSRSNGEEARLQLETETIPCNRIGDQCIPSGPEAAVI